MHNRKEVDGIPQKGRLFVDMDGTLAKYQPVDTMEILYEEGYFRNLEPQQNVVQAVKKIVKEYPDVEVYIMSSVLTDSKYALNEKNAWLDQYLPEIDMEHRIFPSCGENKLDYAPGGIYHTDYLLDDYTKNLQQWEPPAKGIKLLNGINHTNETWNGNMLRYDKEPERLADDIVSVVYGMEIKEERPLQQKVSIENKIYDNTFKSWYLSEGEKSQLEYLTKSEALLALEEGIHICYVNDFPVYHGIHADEYAINELREEKGVRNLYGTWGIGIVHKAFISPYYNNSVELKKMLQNLLQEKKQTQGAKVEKVARKELSI